MAKELLAGFGTSATYRFADGSELSLKVRMQDDVEIIDDAEVAVLQHVVGIDPADVAAPARGESFSISGRTYVIGRYVDLKGGLARYEAV